MRSLQDRLRADLTAAMKAKDGPAMRVIRATLAALANAEAPPISSAPRDVVGQLAEVPRLELSDAEVAEILRAEIADREDTIRRFTDGDKHDEAAELEHELSILRGYLDEGI